MTPEIESNWMTFKDYAQSRGVGYEAIRQKVNRLEARPELKGHVHEVRGTRYLDEEAIAFLDQRQRTAPVVVIPKEQNESLQDVRRELEEVKEDRDRQRSEKEEYMKKTQSLMEELMKFKDNPELTIDSTKYMLIEDHEKVEKELAEKEEKITELTEENTKLKQDADALKDVTLKNVNLARKNEEQLKEIEEKAKRLREEQDENDKIRHELSDIRIKNNEIEAEKKLKEQELANKERQIEEEREEAKRQYEEALNMGFFARLKKKKELKQMSQT